MHGFARGGRRNVSRLQRLLAVGWVALVVLLVVVFWRRSSGKPRAPPVATPLPPESTFAIWRIGDTPPATPAPASSAPTPKPPTPTPNLKEVLGGDKDAGPLKPVVEVPLTPAPHTPAPPTAAPPARVGTTPTIKSTHRRFGTRHVTRRPTTLAATLAATLAPEDEESTVAPATPAQSNMSGAVVIPLQMFVIWKDDQIPEPDRKSVV